MAANYITLNIPFVFTVLLGLLIFQGNGFALFGSDRAWLYVTLSIVFSLLLIGTFFNLGLLVSTLTRQAVSTIVILLLCWILIYGILPRLSIILSQLVYPVKSQQLLAFEKNQIRMENEKECDARIDKLLDSGQSSLEKQKSIRAEYGEKLVESWQKLDREWEKRREIQMSMAMNLARLSPVSCFIRPMAEISKTGWLEYQEFAKDVSRFQLVLNEKVYSQNVFEVTKGGLQSYEGKFSGPAPIFQFQTISNESLMKNVLPDFILLVIYNLLFFAGAYVKFLRYDAR
jgi:ABC-type transport system involved in multi-copper enzyme maturation permease subunit